MGGEGSKKPKVLKRKGREVEEALLFEDQMDEAALQEWERKMGLGQEQSPHQSVEPNEPEAVTETSQDIHLETEGQPQQGEAVPAPKREPSWRQSGKLRWLGLAGVRIYLEEKGPMGKSLFWVGAASVAVCVFLGTLLWVAHSPTPPSQEPQAENSHQMLLELMVPLKQGKAGLLLSLSLELEKRDLKASEVRKELFALISQMEPEELLGEQGIKRLKASVAERLGSKWPWVKREGIRFLEYLVL